MRITHPDLTDPKAAKRYIESPFHCPFCGTQEGACNVYSSNPMYLVEDRSEVQTHYACHKCGQEWRLIYKANEIAE
jgi:transcription elongation factor Elf1